MYGRMGGGTSALSIPGVRTIVAFLLAQIGIYPVIYHGLVPNGGSAMAAANTAALEALWETCIGTTQAVIVFTTGIWSLNATDLTAATPGSIGVSVSIEGIGKSTVVLDFFGSSGPFLNFAPSAGSVGRCHLKQLLITHDSVSTGACLNFSGSISNINIEDVEIARDGFLIGIQSAHSTNMFLTRCKINTRTDYTTMSGGGLIPIALTLVNSSTMGGVFLTDTELACSPKESNPVAYGVLLRLNNTGLIDTVVIGDGCHLIHGGTGILKNSGAGGVSNFLGGKCYITDTEVCLQIEPPSGSVCENFNFTGSWLDGRNYNVLMAQAAGSTVRNISFVGCYGTNAETRGMYFGPGINGINLVGNQIMTSVSSAGECGVEIGDGSTASRDVNLVGGIIQAGGSADGAYVIGSAVDNVTVAHVTQAGVAGVFNGSTSASRVHVAGSVLAL